MKLLSFKRGRKESWGAIGADGGVVDLGAKFGNRLPTLRDYLAANDAAKTRVANHLKRYAEKKSDTTLGRVTLLPPITNPEKVICVGLNYRRHAEETNNPIPKKPVLFARFRDSHVGHGAPMLLPRESRQFDYEGELAVIMGRTARRVKESQALRYVAGYSCYNDGSIRDWQRHTNQVLPGKNFWRSGAFGPWMVTKDEVGDPSRLTLETRLNGKKVQHTGVDDLIFDVKQLIAYISCVTVLEPGDVIVTGTPSGVALARKPPLWMKKGDTIEVEISKVGVLSNPIAAD